MLLLKKLFIVVALTIQEGHGSPVTSASLVGSIHL